MTLDVEVVSDVPGRSRFDQALAVLLGSAAIIAAILATVQLDVSKQEERSLLRSSRLAVRVFELTAGTGAVTAFGALMQRTAIATNAGGIGRLLVAFEQPAVAEVQNALGEAEQAAGDRLAALVAPMAAPSPLPNTLDPHARSLVEIGAADVQAILTAIADPSAPVEFRTAAEGATLTTALSNEVDRADRASARGTLSLLGLALLALVSAAALIAVAATTAVSTL